MAVRYTSVAPDQERLLKPGHEAPANGKYEILDARGISTGQQRFATEGDRLPPTPEPGQFYRLVEVIKPIYTTVSSTAALNTAAETYATAIRRLATK